jgi:hypothetical protein
MRYLFGDSTPFPLSHNFLETLEAVTDTCVALLHLDADTASARRASARRRAQTEDDLARLDMLKDRVAAELAPALARDERDAVYDVAVRVSGELQRALAATRRTVTRRATSPHQPDEDAPTRLLERLLVAHELPRTHW